MGSFELTAVLVLAALAFLRAVVVLGFAVVIIRPVRGCPACFRPTVALLTGWSWLLPRRFEWRWCPECGWEGPARRLSASKGLPIPPGQPIPPAPIEPLGGSPPDNPGDERWGSG